MHSGLQDEECLSSLEMNLDENFAKELNPWWTLMYPPWTTPVIKGWSNKKEREVEKKHKVKPCDYLDGASRRDNPENMELWKRKMNKWNQEFLWTSGIRN